MTQYDVDVLVDELRAISELLAPGTTLEELARIGLHLLVEDAGSDESLPAAQEDGADLDQLLTVVASRAARVADLRHQRSEARRADTSLNSLRERNVGDYQRVDEHMTRLEHERDELLAAITIEERRLAQLEMDPGKLAPPLGPPPGPDGNAAPPQLDVRTVLRRWEQADAEHRRRRFRRGFFRGRGGFLRTARRSSE
ncbi:MAG TPA: hypothetical protein VHB18_03600 [Mycobacteriales bacterium]|nr:hypothetical protein [Mycobacteriales bacterium]